MESQSDMTSSETKKSQTARRPWLVLGGLAALAMTALLCLIAMAALIGSFFWLRTAQPAAPALFPAGAATLAAPAVPAVPEAIDVAPPAAASALVSPERAVNRIAFVDPAGRLGTVAPNGDDGRLLTTAGVAYQFPAWAPDSRRIAAIGADGSQGGVYLWADTPDAQADALFTSRAQSPIYLYWSPDSRQVSFLTSERSGLGLWLAAADGASPARQIATGQPFYWDWSQNGEQLFVHSGGQGRDARLAFLDTDKQQAGANVAHPGLFQAPGISHDGRYLAYGQSDGQRLLVAVEEQASGQRVTVPHVGLAALSWSPTSLHLAWTSPRDDQLTFAGPLRIMDAATGDVTTLVQDTVIGFFWSPDGQRIAYLTPASAADNPGAVRPAGLSALAPAQDAQRRPLSFRLWVVDVASGQQHALSTFRPSEIFLSQFIPFFDQYALSHRLWSPASDALVLPMREEDGASGIYVVSVESGQSTRVADGAMAFWSWR